MKTLLKQNGFHNFVDDEDDEQAYKALKEHGDFELIVSDWNMPNMTGLEFHKMVRADKKFNHIPFLMVTAEAEKEKIIEAVKECVSYYIVKPFTGQDFKENLDKIDADQKKD